MGCCSARLPLPSNLRPAQLALRDFRQADEIDSTSCIRFELLPFTSTLTASPWTLHRPLDFRDGAAHSSDDPVNTSRFILPKMPQHAPLSTTSLASLASKQSLTMTTNLEEEKNAEKNAYQVGEAVPSDQDDLATYEIPPAETRKLLGPSTFTSLQL